MEYILNMRVILLIMFYMEYSSVINYFHTSRKTNKEKMVRSMNNLCPIIIQDMPIFL